jgi:hypothetical protein
MDRMGKQAKQTAQDVSTLKNIAIGAVLAKGVSMAANAFMSASRAALSYAASAANAVDQTNDLAQRLGMSVESLQALQMAAKLSGVDDATGALQKLTVAIGNAAESGKTEAFTKLGLDFQQLQAMSPEEQFKAVQSAIAGLATPAERAAAAVSLFGKSGVELLPLMSQNLAEVEERMKRLGAIVGDDQVEAIGGMNDALDMVKGTFNGIIGNVVGNLAPVVESLANDILAMVESFNSVSGSGGEGIANTISNALLDIAQYFEGVFRSAQESFDGFGVTLKDVGAVFEFVGNIFTAIAETLRAAFNLFQIAGNVLAMGLGKFLEGIGSWVSKDLEKFGKDLTANAEKQANQNSREMEGAASNAGAAASRAVFGGNAAANVATPTTDAARERMTPEEKAQRESARKAKEADAKAAREAAAADAKSRKDFEDARKRQDEKNKKISAVDKNIEGKKDEATAILSERAAALGGKSNEALKANDVRSGEGMAQFLALASGREDPAIAEYRKQTQKLNEIASELRALKTDKVTILNGAGA